MAFPERRDFLRAAGAALAGAAAPAALAPAAWAGATVTRDHSQELLVTLSDVDGIRLRKASVAETPSRGGIVLGMFRYESPDGVSKTVHRLVLPWMDVRAGLYLRSAVPYRTRLDLDPQENELTTSIVLDRRTSVAVYRETPRWVDAPPWQVVVVIGTAGTLTTAGFDPARGPVR